MKLDTPNKMFIERSYVMNMASLLNKFTYDSSQDICNFRCAVCGDSKKNMNKKRGYIYYVKEKNRYSYMCHNCGYNASFSYFLKEYFPNTYEQYKKEILEDAFKNNQLANKRERINIKPPVKKVVNIIPESEIAVPVSSLLETDAAYDYCKNTRKLPIDTLTEIKYCKNFNEYLKQYIKEDDRKYPKDARILFELRTKDNILFGVQSRILHDDGQRFLTVKFIEEMPKIYGLHKIDITKKIIVTEGIIDSLFLDNALALCGGDPISNLHEILGVKKEQIYMVHDNEPRSVDTVTRMKKSIEFGYNVCFWNINSNYKDINKMIINGISIKDIENNIFKYSFREFEAKLKILHWSKI